jgi:hypothetical protein
MLYAVQGEVSRSRHSHFIGIVPPQRQDFPEIPFPIPQILFAERGRRKVAKKI